TASSCPPATAPAPRPGVAGKASEGQETRMATPNEANLVNAWKDRFDAARKATEEGRFQEAEGELKAALAHAETLQPDDTRLLQTVDALAEIYYRQDNYADAETQLRRKIAIQERVLGPIHTEIAETLALLSDVCIGHRQFAEAEALSRRELA